MEIKWREATESDIGRLARFSDHKGDDWTFGLLDGIDSQECVYECVAVESESPELFLFCEVQESHPESRVLTCVYCGHEYPQDTPAAGSEILTDHIRQCEKHPMRKLESDRTVLRNALVALVGSGDVAELQIMEVEVRRLPAPAADKAATIDAIHALIATS